MCYTQMRRIEIRRAIRRKNRFEVDKMLFDTHAHLDDRRFDDDRPELLRRLPQRVGLLMNPGCDLASSLAACRLAEEHAWIYAAVGSHPDDAGRMGETELAAYRHLAQEHPKVKAIGEIGLDYHYEEVPRAQQMVCFRQQMALAQELGLPVIVHEREAHADALEILKEFPKVTGVFHCYSGSAEMAQYLVEWGWYIGFTGVITFKNARRLVETALAIPLERMVVETDCPYMAPEPFRGRRNDPGLLYRMTERLAELRGVSPAEMEEITMANGKRLYRLEE